MQQQQCQRPMSPLLLLLVLLLLLAVRLKQQQVINQAWTQKLTPAVKIMGVGRGM
jgi:hypothetical protein